MCAFTYINTHTHIYIHIYMCVCVCACVYVYIYVCIYIYINTYFMCTYIYVLKFPIFCAIWLKKCDFLTEKLGIKSDLDPKLFIPDPDPDPSKSSGSDRIRIRIHNTVYNRHISATFFFYFIQLNAYFHLFFFYQMQEDLGSLNGRRAC
jgi:hypothetical protein